MGGEQDQGAYGWRSHYRSVHAAGLLHFVPQFKLIIAGNHKPSLRSVDEAIRRRLHLIPFTVTIPLAERDPKLSEKLREEWPGVLKWALAGTHRVPQPWVSSAESRRRRYGRLPRRRGRLYTLGRRLLPNRPATFRAWRGVVAKLESICGSQQRTTWQPQSVCSTHGRSRLQTREEPGNPRLQRHCLEGKGAPSGGH